MKKSALSTPVMVTIFKDLGAKSKTEYAWSMRDLLDEIERTEATQKKDLPLLKLATFGTNKTDKGSYRHDANMVTASGVEGDYDLEKMSAEEAAAIFKKANVACVIYTSASHTPEKPRWRVLAPFSDELLPNERTRMLARLNGLVGGTFSRESFTMSQAFYFGDVVGKHRAEMIEVDGDFIDLRDDMDDGAFLPEIVKREMVNQGERESTALDEAQELFERDLESGKLEEALQAALDYRWEAGEKIGSDEDRESWWRNICWAIHHGSAGSKVGYKLWSDYASKSYRASRLKKRGDSVKRAIATEWHYAKDDRAAGVLGFGTVYKQLENDAGWQFGVITVDDFEDDEDDDDEPPAPKKNEVADKTAPEGNEGIPSHLLTIPGVLGRAVDHYNATSTQHQPQFAVQTALALGSVVLGRHWSTEHDNFASVYLVNLGVTGSGKEFSRKFISRALEEAGLGDIVGPSMYASAAGIMSELAWKPRHVTVYDEFGMLLSSTGANSNTNLRDAQRLLMSVFGQLGDVARPVAYSANGKTAQQVEAMRGQKVVRPAITILGLSTPETFFDALTQSDIASGFLNRLLVVNSRRAPQVEEMRAWKKIPSELRSWIVDFGSTGDDDFLAGELATEADGPEIVEFTSGATARLREIAQEVIDLQAKQRPLRLDGLLSRSREIAMRLSLIVAMSRNKKRIDEVSLNWAWDYVRFYTMEMIDNTKRMMGQTPVARIAEHLADAIVAAGKKGLSQRDMGRKSYEFSKLDSRSQNEVIYALTTHMEIVKVNVKKADRGRPTLRYVHEDFA